MEIILEHSTKAVTGPTRILGGQWYKARTKSCKLQHIFIGYRTLCGLVYEETLQLSTKSRCKHCIKLGKNVWTQMNDII